jgi:CBS domain-containing protein
MSIESVPVSSIMTKDVKTAKESQTIRSVAGMMNELGIGSVVIVKNSDERTPVGIITERDIVRLVGSPQVSFAAPVKEVMKKPVITADVMTSVRDAMQTMQVKNIRRLPITEKGKMVGIVTDKDIFRAIVKSQTLLTSLISDQLLIEYRPIYERLSEFMLGEIYRPGENR